MPQVKPSRKSAVAKKKSSKAPSRSAKTASRVAPTAKKTAAKPAKNHSSRVAASDEVAAGEREVPIDRRRAKIQQPPAGTDGAPPLELRKKVNRRRQIDPTTCERDYTDHEVEFMNAIDEYKRKNGRMFPTCSEVLEVVRSLGYVRQPITMSVVHDGTAQVGGQATIESPAAVQ
jgi:hypothetical protein